MRSNQKGLFQHDFRFWDVLEPITLETLPPARDGETSFACAFVAGGGASRWRRRSISAEWGEEQRARFVDALYRVISATGAKTLQEMGGKWHNSALAILKSLVTLDKDMRVAIGKTLALMVKTVGRNLAGRRK